ncbi:unnamed protein product [Orchesella dallaii]|uniref:Uncharacterized protein n=1 Tax=Orchesella dallaii TaxID=48710 RepID=A0ABP1R8I7_9HEXA
MASNNGKMTGKRSRSFKCAVHQRDREVCSESDFHLLPLGYQSPTGVKRFLIQSKCQSSSERQQTFFVAYGGGGSITVDSSQLASEN